MKGICHIWSRGRHFSPSLPGDRYLKVSSHKRLPSRNLGEHRSVRRSGTASRGTALLAFYLRMRAFLRTEALTIFVGKNIRLVSSECKPMFFAFSGGSWQVTSSCAYIMASALKLEIGNNRIPYSLKSCFTESLFFRCLRIWLTAFLVTQHFFVAWTHNTCTLPIAWRLSRPAQFAELSAGITRMLVGASCIETRRLKKKKKEKFACLDLLRQNENTFYYSWSLCHHNGVERKVFKPLRLKISLRQYKLILSTSVEKWRLMFVGKMNTQVVF